MDPLRATLWGPRALPDLLTEQLATQGFAPGDAAECAYQINESDEAARTASLFVDLGSCKFLEGDIDGAVASWRRVITSEHDASAARSLLNLGLLFEHLHLHDRAISVLTSVSERGVEPHVAAAVMASARCYVSVSQPDQAMESMALLAQSIMATGANTAQLTEVLFGLGEVAAYAGRIDRASRAWRAASAGPESEVQQAAVQRLLGLLVDQGHDEEIVEFGNRLSSGFAAAHVPAVLARAESLYEVDRHDEADDLIDSIDSATLVASDRFRLADVHRRAGSVNQAIDQLELLLNSNDTEVEHRAAFSLGQIYKSHDMHDVAVEMYERVRQAGDVFWSPKAALELGDLCAERDQHEQALEHWTFACDSNVAAVRSAGEERIDRAFVPDVESALDAPADGESIASAVTGEVTAVKIESVVEEPVEEPEIVLLNDVDVEPEMADPLVSGPELVGFEVVEPEVLLLDELDVEPEMVDPLVSEPELVGLEVDEPEAGLLDPLLIDLAEPDEAHLVDTVDDVVTLPVAQTTKDPHKSSSSAFRTLSDPNPYAVLAPEGHDSDVAPSSRNPYAELAPDFADDFEPGADVKPGDWEAILRIQEGGAAPASKKSSVGSPKKPPSAFSKYT